MSAPVLVEGAPATTSLTPAQTGLSTTAAVVLVANARRKGFTIQNTGTTVIKITLHATANPTQTVYHYALKACTGADDGTGGVLIEDCWTGTVRAISSAAGGTFVITEFMRGTPDYNSANYLGALS